MTGFNLDERWDKLICDRLFNSAQPSPSPVTVFLGGQPGAGKTSALGRVLHSFPGSITPIIGDDLRAYHPDYDHLIAHDPLLMPERTAPASGYWISRAVAYANEHQFSSLIEGTWRLTSTVLNEAGNAKRHFRATHAVVVAVPPALSRASIAERFYWDLLHGETARWTPLSAHENTVRALPSVVHDIFTSPLIDTITIASRTVPVLASSHTMSRKDLIDVFMSEHTRTLSVSERDYIERLLPHLREAHTYYTPTHKESSDLLDLIEDSLRSPQPNMKKSKGIRL